MVTDSKHIRSIESVLYKFSLIFLKLGVILKIIFEFFNL